MPKLKNALFIVNKYSGGGYNANVEGRIIDECKSLNIESILEFTQNQGHAIQLARNAVREQIDFVFAVGGDGTVNEVAQGLIGSRAVMGILPKGSGNGLARHLGIPMSFKKSLGILRNHQEQLIDTMIVNGKLSVNVAGIGFDGHIASLFAKKEKRGLAGYSKLVLKEFINFKPFEAEISINQKTLVVNPFIIALANSSQFGNNARVAPQASVCDQLIDVCFLKKVPMIHAPGFAGRMFAGNLAKSKFVDIVKTDRLTIKLNKVMAYHIDGEAMSPANHFEVRIQPASLRVFLPKTSIAK